MRWEGSVESYSCLSHVIRFSAAVFNRLVFRTCKNDLKLIIDNTDAMPCRPTHHLNGRTPNEAEGLKYKFLHSRSLAVSVLVCQLTGPGFKSVSTEMKLVPYMRPLGDLAMTSTLPVHCRWEDETSRERTDHPPTYAETTRKKSLGLYTHGCLWL